MTMPLTLTQVKDHLRVDQNQDDPMISVYWLAAEQYVAKYLGEDMPDPVPKPIQAAILLLTGDLYANRERQGDLVFYKNHTYQLLLNPYRSAEVL